MTNIVEELHKPIKMRLEGIICHHCHKIIDKKTCYLDTQYKEHSRTFYYHVDCYYLMLEKYKLPKYKNKYILKPSKLFDIE
jgi:hypothetical protein